MEMIELDDSIKQQLLDSLAKEPPMVISTAYVYAKNHVYYGEDITKAWTTAVQQITILDKVKQKAWAEAYDSFKANYENRLKADMAAMLEEIRAQIVQLPTTKCTEAYGRHIVTDDFKEYDLDISKIEYLRNNVLEIIDKYKAKSEK